ncbi:hypothetical protein CALVIDRAFT_563467 [Calocera viscosa TUFC12733]|uniref:Uncharacterized protein n=1 Tax=Calocera viscosa (strain TUFC12733) TaxID=1330018 RepID=A0A167MKP2_CALVF|nr:hypothetical protein CALVIDRAFT_563467 [Calocera viscosa TUFC12733]
MSESVEPVLTFKHSVTVEGCQMEALKNGYTLLMYPDDPDWHDCESYDGEGKLANSWLTIDEGKFYYDDFNSLDHPPAKKVVEYHAVRTGNKFVIDFYLGPIGGLGQAITIAQFKIDNYTGDMMPKVVDVKGTCKFKPYGTGANGLSARKKFPGKD